MEGMIVIGTVTIVSMTGFVVLAVLWLQRLRATVASALTEAANQQVRTAQRLSDSIAQVQKQQSHYEQQLHLLAQANAQLRQGLVHVATRLDHTQAEAMRGDQTLH